MKKVTFFIVLLLTGIGAIYARPVPLETAKTVAGNFYRNTYLQSEQLVQNDFLLTYIEKDNSGQPVYYVFNVKGNNGFVIVSAEDAGSPVIGSSNTGNYIVPAKNNNISFWMGIRKGEILAMRASNMVATLRVSAEWNTYINNTSLNSHSPLRNAAPDSVSPLCKTRWDQYPYYNAMCPGTYPQQSVTGCVATAMAQIMKYWAFPNVGMGSNCYNTNSYGELCAEFDTSNYVWAEMPEQVGSAEYKECSQLMYDVGVSVEMDYSPTGSGAYVIGGYPSAEYSYITFFNYNSATINGVYQSDYTDSAWISLIENELNNKRPVQYQGFDNTEGGHSWVCDGYNTNNELHMNWGWSGYDNGWYNAFDLAPTGLGLDFSDWGVGAIIGIEPGTVTSVHNIINNPSCNVYPNPSNGEFTIQPSVNGQWSVEVYNTLGQRVYSELNIQPSIVCIDLSNQPKGTYIYRILSENSSAISTGRLIIE